MEGTQTPHGEHVQVVMDAARSSRPARLASIVVDELARQIVSGTLSEGAVLPTEGALCEQFGFSRTVMREGMKLLEERGLVRVEQGRGTTVQPRDSWSLLDPVVLRIALANDHDLSLLDNLIAVRRVLEQEMARDAASRLSDDDLAALLEAIDQMSAAYDDYGRFQLYDRAFHAIVMKASGNEVGLTIVRTIHAHAGALPPIASLPSRDELERTTAEHRGIQEALAAGDGELAAERIAAHIDSAWAERRSRRDR